MSGPSGLKDEIEAANARFMSLCNSGDMTGLAALYTEDAEFLAPGHESFVGQAAIQQVLTGLRGEGATLRLETREVAGVGDSAWELGRYTLTATDGAVADRGKYIVIWTKVGGAWRLHRDILNSSLPA